MQCATVLMPFFFENLPRLILSLRYNADIHTCPLKMIANWKSLPDGTLFALGEDIETLADAERIFTLLDAGDPEESGEFRSSSYRSFPLKIDGQPYDGPLPCIAFNREGGGPSS